MDAGKSPSTAPSDRFGRRADWQRIVQGAFVVGVVMIAFYGLFELSGGDHVWGVIALGLIGILLAVTNYMHRE
jgi:hypothetical protein